MTDLDWAFHADDAAVLDALRTGRHRASLGLYFGADAHLELAQLAAMPIPALDAAPRVLILPGIMGSRLGGPPRASRPFGVVWVDPQAVAAGGLRDLALPRGRDLQPMGVVLFAYAKLLLQLRLAGFDAAFHPYDWRLGLDELGSGLAARIRGDDKPVALLGHSMGGLVARMALRSLPKRWVRKLILVGTPNGGAYSPLQALRGTYPFVRKMSTLDPVHSPEQLAADVFHSFPGLYQLLPPGEPRRWPKGGPPLNRALFRLNRSVRAGLARPDGRMVQIVGVGRPTIAAVRCLASGFQYRLDERGDGSVPLWSARLPRVRTYFVDEAHARLVDNAHVIAAVIDLLRRGRTAALPTRWRASGATFAPLDDATLAAEPEPKIDWAALTAAERAALLAEMNR